MNTFCSHGCSSHVHNNYCTSFDIILEPNNAAGKTVVSSFTDEPKAKATGYGLHDSRSHRAAKAAYLRRVRCSQQTAVA